MMRELIERAFAMVFDPKGVSTPSSPLQAWGERHDRASAHPRHAGRRGSRDDSARRRIINNVINHRMIS